MHNIIHMVMCIGHWSEIRCKYRGATIWSKLDPNLKTVTRLAAFKQLSKKNLYNNDEFYDL